jgi:hypothetical protein
MRNEDAAMYEWQANAFLLRPGRVLEKDLHPFTVGHAFLLESIRSPYFYGGKRTKEDLLIAVLICSQSFEDACVFIVQPPEDLKKQVKKWGKAASASRIGVDFDGSQFEKYIQEYSRMPDRWIDPDPVKAMKACDSAFPSTMRLAWNLMSHGVSEKDAYNMPYNRALQYYGIESESNGGRYVTDEEDAVIESIPESANGCS